MFVFLLCLRIVLTFLWVCWNLWHNIYTFLKFLQSNNYEKNVFYERTKKSFSVDFRNVHFQSMNRIFLSSNLRTMMNLLALEMIKSLRSRGSDSLKKNIFFVFNVLWIFKPNFSQIYSKLWHYENFLNYIDSFLSVKCT